MLFAFKVVLYGRIGQLFFAWKFDVFILSSSTYLVLLYVVDGSSEVYDDDVLRLKLSPYFLFNIGNKRNIHLFNIVIHSKFMSI